MSKSEKIIRREGWETALAAYLAQVKREPFAWGAHDCCLHAAAALQAQTGVDAAAEIRGTYHDAKGAAAMLRRRYRGSTFRVPEKHGLQAAPVKLAQRGFIVGKKMERRAALGVCYGAKSYFVGKDGLIAVPTLACERAWRVG